MSAPQQIDRTQAPAPNWRAQMAVIADVLDRFGDRLGIDPATAWRVWADPRPHIGHPVASFKPPLVGLPTFDASRKRPAGTDWRQAEEEYRRRSDEKYQEVVDRLRRYYGLD